MAQTEVSSEKKGESKSSEKKEKPLTKVIVRRLPPSIDLETFLNQISPAPDYNYIYLAKGDSSLGENCFARVYINFICPEDVYNFKERFDNYVFLDSKGHEYPAVVEFASFQKIPKKRGKVRMDPKCGTIESDPLYSEFVKLINKPMEQDEKPEYSLQLTTENKNDTTTPLLDYINNKRAERQKYREGRREERKRKELERRKGREDERKRINEEKSPHKTVVIKPQGKTSPKEDKTTEDEVERDTEKESPDDKPSKVYERSLFYKNKEKKFDKYEERRKEKPKYKDFPEKRDFKRGEDREYRSKYDYDKKEKYEYKKERYDGYRKEKYEEPSREETKSTKKVKKYSEKREERKMEAQKAEQRKLEQAEKNKESPPEDKSAQNKTPEKKENVENKNSSEASETPKKVSEKTEKERKEELKEQKRIRNKDRPALTIYRPGMLSKRKQVDGDNENK